MYCSHGGKSGRIMLVFLVAVGLDRGARIGRSGRDS